MRTACSILLLVLLLVGRCHAQDVTTVHEPAARVPAPAALDALRTLSPSQRRALPAPAPARTPRRRSPFISALQEAWKKGIVEESVEGYSEVLIQCQKEQSPALTMPFLRSDSQQSHCFRF
jgi:hypothetical protein